MSSSFWEQTNGVFLGRRDDVDADAATLDAAIDNSAASGGSKSKKFDSSKILLIARPFSIANKSITNERVNKLTTC